MFTIDIEPTNRCNAKCHFCPRDATPHQGLMTQEVFSLALERAVEFREAALAHTDFDCAVSLCGLGEPLLNRNLASFASQVVESGIACTVSSNAALLDEQAAHALLDAGVSSVFLNVSERDDDYEDIYKLPFAKTRDNVLRFAELAEGRCEVSVVLVDHRVDRKHLRQMRRYWRDQGIQAFRVYEIMNRGGSLFVDHMQFARYDEQGEAVKLLEAQSELPVCAAPFVYLFIGWDGRYYLCCSDWEKRAPFGDVASDTLLEVMGAKMAYVTERKSVCQTCNLDPRNRLTEALRGSAESGGGEEATDVVDTLAEITNNSERLRAMLADLDAALPGMLQRQGPLLGGADAVAGRPAAVTLTTKPGSGL